MMKRMQAYKKLEQKALEEYNHKCNIGLDK